MTSGTSRRACWRRRCRIRDGDSGSIVLALLAILMITISLGLVAASVTSGQRQGRFDVSFERALQVSEDGLNRMVSLVQSDPSAASIPAVDGTSGDGTYSVTATPPEPGGHLGKSGTSWTVDSVGRTPDGQSRHTRVTVQTFNLAAFGRQEFHGGNAADSFDSRTAGGTNLCTDFQCTTGHGTVATNGRLFVKGATGDAVDRMEIFNAKDHVDNPLPTSTGHCDGDSTACGMDTTSPPKLSYHREALELPGITRCAGVTMTSPFAGTGTLSGGVHGFTDVTLTKLTGFSTSKDNPTILCMSGKLTVDEGNSINFNASGTEPNPPGTLYILNTYSAELTFEKGAKVSAAIYAPNASFQGEGQGDIFGSLVVDAISGEWKFHYDDALSGSLINTPVIVSDWVEVR